MLPLLQAKCIDCHGDSDQESNLRVDRKASLLRGGDSGEPAILVGNSGESYLIKLVARLDADLAMPPDEDDRLTAGEIGLLRAWVDQGVHWPGPHGVVTRDKPTSDHWAFQPLQPVAVAQVDESWIAYEVDEFILDELRRQGLSPNKPADRRTLIRRIYVDMLGLPPTPAQVHAFVEDSSPFAYEKLIDTVLESPRYGERWARY